METKVKVAKKVWRAITTEYLENLYESMPRCMAAVKEREKTKRERAGETERERMKALGQ